MHGRIYIILKESLKSLPIFGWGAQFYNFIFLSRKWETDKYRFKSALNHLRDPNDPMWLLIFPEGTNLSATTREKSAAWAKKTGIPDMKNQLLPRSTGLQFCLKELRQTTNWLYDCTIAYEGVPKGQYGQDIYTLRSSFFEGRPPKSVNMFWRRFKIAEIPLDTDEAFGRWLTNRWREKDYILEYFNKYGQFPAEDPVKALAAANGKRKPNHAKIIGTELKGGGWDEFLSIFGPITSAAGALSAIDMTEPIDLDALLNQVARQQQLNLLNIGKAPLAEAGQEAVRRALRAAQKSKALPPGVLNYLMKETPQTQEQMKNAIIVSAKRSGNTDLAKKAAQAPASKKAIPTQTQKDVSNAAKQTQKVISHTAIPRQNNTTKPTTPIPKPMPMANTESMITRPLTTMAVQSAASTLRNVAAKRTQAKGAALPGQQAAAKKSTESPAAVKRPGLPPKAASVASAPVGKKPPSKLNTVNGARRASVMSVPALNKTPPGSKPVGTQKYVNGVKT
jgi:hypothetical protein